jgi:uncharacterized membrane protein
MPKKVNQRHKDGGEDSCDWPLNNVCVFVHSVYNVYEVATQWGGYVYLLVYLIIHKFHLCDCRLDFKIFSFGSLH